MNFRTGKFAAGVSLIDAMAAMLILSVMAVGAMGYQYYAAIHARIACAQMVATRTAQLLLEDWKSTGGSSEYDPSILKLGFNGPLQVPADWSEGIPGGLGQPLNSCVYGITVDGLPMLVMLNWLDVDKDDDAGIKLRQISVTVRLGASSGGSDVESRLANLEPIILVTYVRSDASAG
jgi:hypothetical protein